MFKTCLCSRSLNHIRSCHTPAPINEISELCIIKSITCLPPLVLCPLQVCRQGSWSCPFQMDVLPKSTSLWSAAGLPASKSAPLSLILSTPWGSCRLTAKSDGSRTHIRGELLSTPFPPNKDRNAGLVVSHISGKRVAEKTFFYMHFKKCVCVWIRLFTVSVETHSCLREWLLVSSARGARLPLPQHGWLSPHVPVCGSSVTLPACSPLPQGRSVTETLSFTKPDNPSASKLPSHTHIHTHTQLDS